MRTGNPNVDDVLRKRHMGLDVAITFAVEGIMPYDVSAIVEGVQEAVDNATAWTVDDVLEAVSALGPEHPAFQAFLRGTDPQ